MLGHEVTQQVGAAGQPGGEGDRGGGDEAGAEGEGEEGECPYVVVNDICDGRGL